MKISQENTIDRCRFCFMCRHVCSAARATHIESITPRSQGLVMSLINRGAAVAGPDVVANVYNCTQCRWCREWCEGGWDFSACIIAAREVFLHESLATETVLKRLKQLDQQTIQAAGSTDMLLLAEPTWVAEAVAQTESAVRLLRQAGFTVQATNVPSPVLALYLLGDRSAAARHLQQLIEKVRSCGCGTVAVVAPGDAYVLRELPALLGTDALPEPIRIRTLADLMLEAFMNKKLQPQMDETTWTYHDDDFSARYIHETEALPSLLGAIPGLTVAAPVWRGRLARSSGGASMGCTEMEIVAELADLRVRELLQTRARHIVTMTADDAALLTGAAPADVTVRTLTGLLESALLYRDDSGRNTHD
jgi:Fe-S oxidoreductase